ncbi:MAG TPA: Rrf2 family transcriptional regulator [Thermoleophilia bacterium]|nr:Rrf2 family transcriptional regulator [Thermoleophilia bacterium]
MNITSKSKYAVRALVELARRGQDEPVPLMVLAEARGIPGQFLEQLFATLRRAGILQSFRGVHGGFSFNRPPDQVTVLDVVEALDGPIEPALCTTDESCERRPVCSVGDVWVQAKLSVEEVLSGVTIQDLATRESSLTGTSMYYI